MLVTGQHTHTHERKKMLLNLTQHQAQPEQVANGVLDLEEGEKENLKSLLTFDDLPDSKELLLRAQKIAELASREFCEDDRPWQAMIGGAPYLMAPLERALRARGIQPLYAFSKRESVETIQPDGTVHKKSIFRHLGFVAVSGGF